MFLHFPRKFFSLTHFVLPDPSQSKAGDKTTYIPWSRVRVQTNLIDRHAGLPWKEIQAVQQREFRRFHESARCRYNDT